MHGVDIVQDDDLLSIEPNSVIKKGFSELNSYSKSKIRNQKFGIENSKSKIRNRKVFSFINTYRKLRRTSQ